MTKDNFDREKHLKEIHKKRKEETNERVDEAIKKLIKNQREINFQTVAEVANVNRSTLYKRPKIKKRIKELRQKYKKVESPSEVNNNITSSNKDAIISSLKRKIKKLEQDKKELKKENEELKKKLRKKYGEVYKQT